MNVFAHSLQHEGKNCQYLCQQGVVEVVNGDNKCSLVIATTYRTVVTIARALR